MIDKDLWDMLGAKDLEIKKLQIEINNLCNDIERMRRVNNIVINEDNKDIIENRIKCIKDLLSEENDITIALGEVEILKYKDSYIRFSIDFEYDGIQGTKEIVITDYEINDLNMLYRYLKANIIYR